MRNNSTVFELRQDQKREIFVSFDLSKEEKNRNVLLRINEINFRNSLVTKIIQTIKSNLKLKAKTGCDAASECSMTENEY